MDEDAPMITRWQADKDAWQSKIKKWEHASEIVLVIGLALELTALPHHFKEAGQLAKDAADAKESAEEANERASSNEVVALGFKKEIAIINSNAAALARLTEPRILSNEQIAKLKRALADGSICELDISFAFGCAECGELAKQLRAEIVPIFGRVGLIFETDEHRPPGVKLFIADTNSPPACVASLQPSLKDAGLGALAIQVPSLPPNKVVIWIGVKPTK